MHQLSEELMKKVSSDLKFIRPGPKIIASEIDLSSRIGLYAPKFAFTGLPICFVQTVF
jgi:hypothetical protein